jgi:hypothetical protein
MTPTETNRRVAEALGWEIVPFEVMRCAVSPLSDRRGFVVENNGGLLLPPSLSWWSPSTRVEHAIAALEAWQAKTHGWWTLCQEGQGRFVCEIIAVGDSAGPDGTGKTACGAICAAILAAKEERDG